jgi:hypothetical protein
MKAITHVAKVAFSVGCHAKPRGTLHKFIEIQGYAYCCLALLFFIAPFLARSLLFILPDEHTVSDGGIRWGWIPVFGVGLFYIVGGRSGSDALCFATMLNRIPLVVVPALTLAAAGQLDWGVATIMALGDGGFCMATIAMYMLLGDASLRPSDQYQPKPGCD